MAQQIYDAELQWTTNISQLANPSQTVERIVEGGKIGDVVKLDISTTDEFLSEARKNLAASVLSTTAKGVARLCRANQVAGDMYEAASTVLQWLLVLRKYMHMMQGGSIQTQEQMNAWRLAHGERCMQAVKQYWTIGQAKHVDKFRAWPATMLAKTIELEAEVKAKRMTEEEKERQWPKLSETNAKMISQMSMFMISCTFDSQLWQQVQTQTASAGP